MKLIYEVPDLQAILLLPTQDVSVMEFTLEDEETATARRVSGGIELPDHEW